ncbi:RNase H domain containing protein [Beauveria bassiana ARSEF 2860]|uniref:RNase H domain containing protein n=1 Tax=Beauveria bassiana (strain ARSEF 2860) TaxID=655819 RepID=J4KNM6_BEAB2|nr:RNase H domain containing protein [Beauveria bassiana ARSEF 2860]EJP65969.1 RNase H domain containing protein [Beauveria bassiana ARSEF 2860]
MNWVIFVSFDDGVQWAFRSPRTGCEAIISDDSVKKMLLSEVATLKVLREKTTVPVPEVYSFRFGVLIASCDNDIGVPYILMSKAAGRSLREYHWINCTTSSFTADPLRLPLPDGARENIMRQLGDITGRLSRLRFDKIGSVFEDGLGSYVVGECLSPALIWQHRDSLEDTAVERGPFTYDGQYLASLISALVGHAKELAAANRWSDYVAVGANVENSKNVLDFCLAGQVLQQMIPRISMPEKSYTLFHPDLNLGNIFVDGEFNITCLIDWGSASSGPLSELLTTPGLQTRPPEQQFSAFRQGFAADNPPPAESWDKADMMWSFSRLVRLTSKYDFAHLKDLYRLVYRADAEDDDVTELFRRMAAEEENKKLLEELRENDLAASELHKLEAAAFGTRANSTDSRAIARKLSVVAEMNKNFVTTSKLWRWIEAALETQPDTPQSL